MLLSGVRTRGFVFRLDATWTSGRVKLRCHRFGYEVPNGELASIARAEGARPLLEVHLCVGDLQTTASQEAAIAKVNDE
jgi:hypothetical protein